MKEKQQGSFRRSKKNVPLFGERLILAAGFFLFVAFCAWGDDGENIAPLLRRTCLDTNVSFGYPLGPGIGTEVRINSNTGTAFGIRTAVTPGSFSLLFPRELSDDTAVWKQYRTLDGEWGIFAGYLLAPSSAWEILFDLSFGGYLSYRAAHFTDTLVDIDTDYSKLLWLPEGRINITASLSPRALFGKSGSRGFRVGIRLGIPIRELSYIYARSEATLVFSWRWRHSISKLER